jgi:hypothetical protein
MYHKEKQMTNDLKRTTTPAPLPVGICAHFSVSMASRHALNSGFELKVRPVTDNQAQGLARAVLDQYAHRAAGSCIGYRNTAAVLSDALGVDVPWSRAPVALEVGDSVLLCHLSGERLPEFADSLPEGTHLQYFVLEMGELGDRVHDGAAS